MKIINKILLSLVMLLLCSSSITAQIAPIKKKTQTTTTKGSKSSSHKSKSKSSGHEHSAMRSVNVNTEQITNQTFTVNGVTFKMIGVQGGSFSMGATTEQGLDKSDIWSHGVYVHKVAISSFLIGETEVTQALWLAVMGNNPSWYTSARGYSDNLNRPVDYVNWFDCQEFIEKLNMLTGAHFRLPTEAEWEYAARGGNKSKGYRYAGSNTLDDVAWYINNSKVTTTNIITWATHSVAQKLPNEIGIYDMAGNVCEWCSDWSNLKYYLESPINNPKGPINGSNRVERGGDCSGNDYSCRVSSRGAYGPMTRQFGHGLRLAL